MPGRITELSESQIVADLLADRRRQAAATTSVQMPQPAKDTFTVASTPATTYTLNAIPYQGSGGSSLNLSLNGLELVEGVDYTVDYTTAIVTVSATLKGTPTPADVLTADYWTTGDLIALAGPAITGSITDNFNRADSTTTLGTTSDGLATWAAVQGTWGISSNAAYCPHVNGSGSVPAFAVIDATLADGAVQGTLGGTGSWDFGIVFRYADPNNYWAMTWLGGLNASRVVRRVAGTGTVMATFTAVAGDVIKASFSGSALTFYKNGASFYAPTDTANQTNTQHGLFALASNVGTLDDWSFTS